MLTSACFLLTVSLPAAARPPRKKKKTPTTGTLQIFSFAKGAKVEINGKQMGALPRKKPFVLKPGKYTVRVYKRGYTEFLEAITIKAGKAEELEADLIAFAGIVQINANVPMATVAIDGKLAGKVPFDRDVPAGKHTIVVQAKGHQPFKQQVEVEAGKPLVLNVELPVSVAIGGDKTEGGIHTKWWFWTIIGVVVAGGTATGLALGLQGASETEATPDTIIKLP